MRAVKAKHLRMVASVVIEDPSVKYKKNAHAVKITTGELNEDGTRKIVTVLRHTRTLDPDCQRGVYKYLKSQE